MNAELKRAIGAENILDEMIRRELMSPKERFEEDFKKKYRFETEYFQKGLEMLETDKVTKDYVNEILASTPSSLDTLSQISSAFASYQTVSTLEKFEVDFKQKYGFEFSLLVETFKKEKEELFI